MFPLINGVGYSWASVKAEILGGLLVGVTEINYGDKDNKENNYGAGRQPVERGYGNIEPHASLGLYKSTTQALQAKAPNGRIQDIPPFDITVAWVTRDGKFMREVIKNAEFTENKVEVKQGDTKVVSVHELIVSDIDWAKK